MSGGMYYEKGALGLELEMSVTQESLKHWIETSLKTFQLQNPDEKDVMGFIFVSQDMVGSIGAYEISAILKEAHIQHDKWLEDIQILATDKPVPEDKIVAFLKAYISEVSHEPGEDAFFGYKTEAGAEERRDDDLVCVVRKLTEEEIEGMDADKALGYEPGSWCAIGYEGDKVKVSEPCEDREEAFDAGTAYFGAIKYISSLDLNG